MGNFSRPGAVAAASYHSYVTEEKTLHNIGLASYTRNSLAKFGTKRKGGSETLDPSIKEYFGGTFPSGELLGDKSTLSIMKFDKDYNRYLLRTSAGQSEESLWYTPSGAYAGTLADFQKDFDLLQKGFLTNELTKYKLNHIWSNIQTSMSGCITFTMSYKVLSCDKTSLVKLYFQSGGKTNTNRGVAQKGSPIIAGVPTRVTGPGYASGPTQSTQPGQYVPPLEGGANNPQNSVAGRLRMSYDQTTGQWESGTQQAMFRLLTDIDGVPQIDLPDNVDDVDLSAFYGGAFSSKFNTGIAMVVTTENGNPHLFGPNSNGCGPSPKEKVIMVNRTPRSYKKGEHVIGSLINGEWIPIGLGMPSTVTKKMDVEWSQIQKYIVDAKSFFRNALDNDFVTPEDYTQHVRFKFYSSLKDSSNAATLTASGNDLNRLAVINMNPQSINSYTINSEGKIELTSTVASSLPNYDKYMSMIPSTGYFQFFDADVIKTNLGGNNDKSRLKKTNIKQTPLDMSDLNEIYAENVTSSWGLYFPDGYTSASVARLKSQKEVTNAFSSVSAGAAFPIYSSTTLDFSSGVNPLFDVSDNYLYHFPAQIALNASGNQSILSQLLWFKQSLGGSYADNLIAYFNDQLKGDYLRNSLNKDAFALSPANSTSVQFTPLSLELALCSTYIPETHTLPAINGGYDNLRRNLAYQGWTRTAFGKAWERNGFPQYGFVLGLTDSAIVGNIGFGERLIKLPIKYGPNTVRSGSASIDVPFRLDIRSDGGPSILPAINGNESSNVVGILAAKATINLTAGGQLELRTTNHFGLNAGGTVTGGGGFLSFIPTMFGIVPGADGRSETRKFDFVQWGSSSSYGDLQAFGTTALYCSIHDHCPSSIYDGRYITPLQFHGDSKDLSNKPIEIEIPANGLTKKPLDVGSLVSASTLFPITMIKNPIRKNMLLTGGGFYYIKRVIGADVSKITIESQDPKDPMSGYSDGDIVTFPGPMPATFTVKTTDANGVITSIAIDDSLGIDAYGEFNDNPFRNGPLQANVNKPKNKDARGAKILLKGGKVIEKVMHDALNSYNIKPLTPADNDGGGDSYGYVRSSKSTTFNLAKNTTGKYDILFFFVNDIANYPENSSGANAQLETNPFAQYVKLDISAN